MDSSDAYEESVEEIVIVGGGICGLSTALALHKKGLRCVVLEKSETLRAAGVAISILPNGWRALDELGVSSQLRNMALPLTGGRDVNIADGKERTILRVNGEARCLIRSDLVETLADALPPGTVRFGCDIVSVETDLVTTFSRLRFSDGKSMVARILIGCDGSRSMVADFLGLKRTRCFALCAIRGLTNYPNGHSFPHEFVRMRKGNVGVGRIPITDKLVHWFVVFTSSDATKFPQDPKSIREEALQVIRGYPTEVEEMIQGCEESLSFTHLRYRAPWDVLLGKFRKGTVTVAGDAMHVMGPFIGQGGSASMEDAVVLARNLAKCYKVVGRDHDPDAADKMQAEAALDGYVKERRMRVVQLSTQSYLTGVLLGSTSLLLKLAIVVAMNIFFRNPAAHTDYNCGLL